MGNFIYKNNKYYRNNSDGTQTEVTPTKEGYFTWIQPDGQKVRTKETYIGFINSHQSKQEKSFLSKMWDGFISASMNSVTGDPSSSAVAYASGWDRDKNGNMTQTLERQISPGVTQLRDNLAEMSGMAYGAELLDPEFIRSSLNIVRHPIQTGRQIYNFGKSLIERIPQVRNYTLFKTLNNNINPIINTEPILNIGWGPKQTIDVIHKSNQLEPLRLFNPKRWDVVNEGANPFGIWWQGNFGKSRTIKTGSTLEKAEKAEKARNLFRNRIFLHEGKLTLNKPIITIGKVPNRSVLSYEAEKIGADGIIYNDVYDNGYDLNQVILGFKYPLEKRIINTKNGFITIGDLELHPEGFYHESSGISKNFIAGKSFREFNKGEPFYNYNDDIIELLNPEKVKLSSKGTYEQIEPLLESEIRRYIYDPEYGYRLIQNN